MSTASPEPRHRKTLPNPSPAADADSADPKGVVAGNRKDAGNRPNNHYKHKLSPLRYAIRSFCLPIVRKETNILAALQDRVRTPTLDIYFAWTANLASHTFYVLMLPPLFWFGASTMGRDLVFVLGMGIYVTGFLKDFLCLPRPRSPPLHRITMLSYTAQEYGWPSSHSANATSVALVLLSRLMGLKDSLSAVSYYALALLLALYYFSLIVGRLYCGMHGFVDVLTGFAIGVTLFLVRYSIGETYDRWLLFSESRNASWLGMALTVAFLVFGHLYLIHIYPEPVDDCPCFDDSVAFIAVLMGVDLSHYACALTNYFTPTNVDSDPLLIPFRFDCGLLKMAARFVVGIALVVTWKLVLKPAIFTILPPLYKMIGVNFPRSNFISTAHTTNSNRQIRRQSISNVQQGDIDIEGLLPLKSHETVSYGPETDIDAYELLDYRKQNQEAEIDLKISGVFKPRYDVEIIGRVIIYSGISVVAIWGFGFTVQALSLV